MAGACMAWGACVAGGVCLVGETATAAAGTHPTRMHEFKGYVVLSFQSWSTLASPFQCLSSEIGFLRF